MKKHFITGLAILLPVALTLAIIIFIFNFLTEPFVGIVRDLFDYFNLLETSFLFLTSVQLQTIVSKVLILGVLVLFTLLLGAAARLLLASYVIQWWDAIIHRIPFVSTIYKTSQDVIKTLFAAKTKSFKKVVLVPFPSPETRSVGLVTGENLKGLPDSENENIVTVFVPTTPNPTSGFLMLYNAKELVYLDMSVEEAFKYIISCGVIMTPFKEISPEEGSRRRDLQEEFADLVREP